MRRLFLLVALACQASIVAEQGPDDSAKTQTALSAAPRSVAAGATVMEWADRRILREGSNGYVCFPTTPSGSHYPMCLDETWIRWIESRRDQEAPPTPSAVAVGYWLQGVGAPGRESAIPHVAILVPDPSVFDGMTTDPSQGGPWVMFKGTPYVHLMVPAPRPGGE